VNTEYNYKFAYPNKSEVSFISSLGEDTDVTKADTVTVDLSPKISVRIQALRTADAHSDTAVIDSIQLGKNDFYHLDVESPCKYVLSNESGEVTLCLLITPDLGVEQLQDNKLLVDLFRSIEFF